VSVDGWVLCGGSLCDDLWFGTDTVRVPAPSYHCLTSVSGDMTSDLQGGLNGSVLARVQAICPGQTVDVGNSTEAEWTPVSPFQTWPHRHPGVPQLLESRPSQGGRHSLTEST
jgi:hypothetical protein